MIGLNEYLKFVDKNTEEYDFLTDQICAHEFARTPEEADLINSGIADIIRQIESIRLV